MPEDALEVVRALNASSADLIDISGGTYFPGAASASDGAGRGPYFAAFGKAAREVTGIPVMVTGGFKTRAQAEAAINDGSADAIGIARAFVLDPDLPTHWQATEETNPAFPKFEAPPEGGITAWYTMQITALAERGELRPRLTVEQALSEYAARDDLRTALWLKTFGRP